MKYYIIAGEASGDLHASFLIQEIKNKDKDAQIHAFGGEMMRHAGAKIIKSIKELSFMGFIEVVANLKTVLRNIKVCKQDILSFNPHCVILVDFAKRCQSYLSAADKLSVSDKHDMEAFRHEYRY